MKDYWPQPKPGTTLIIRFDVGRLDFYRGDGSSFTLGDFWHRAGQPDTPESLIWSSTWHYRVDPIDGVVEFGDDYPPLPGTSTKERQSRFLHGNEIPWGNHLRIGQTLDQKVGYDGNPQRRAFARQRVTLVAIYPTYQVGSHLFYNVIRLDDRQDVCRNGSYGPGSLDQSGSLACGNVSTNSSTYYLAPGLGIVRIQNAVLDGKPDFVPMQSVSQICSLSTSTKSDYCPTRAAIP
jgi:hypothetical protein